MKTTFGPGVVVTSKFLNGAQQIYFDGADLDWHYAPINLNDIQRGGVAGIDNAYVTLDTDQVLGNTPIIGRKSFLGLVGCALIEDNSLQSDDLTGDQVYLDIGWDSLSTVSKEIRDRIASDYALHWQALRGMLRNGGTWFLSDDHEFWNNYPLVKGLSPFIQALRLPHVKKAWQGTAKNGAQNIQRVKPVRFFDLGSELSPEVSFCMADLRAFRTEKNIMPVRQFKKIIDWLKNLTCPGIVLLSQPIMEKLSGEDDRNFVFYQTQYKQFVKAIHDYAVDNNKDWMVGYFGDTAQSIYDDGVGRKIADLHGRVVNVDKIFNRRSHQKIIDVANKIRADEIVQVPICEERNNGSVRFFYNSSDNKLAIAQQFLAGYKHDLIKDNGELGGIYDEEAKIHCLVLTNKLMASFNGFGDVYEVFQKSEIYYDNLNAQVLSQQLEKLHPTILILYYFVKFYQDIQQGMVSYYDIFGALSKNMAFSKASLVVRELKNNEVVLFKDWVSFIIDRLKNSAAKEALSNALINRVKCEKDKVVSSEVFESMLLGAINSLMNGDSEDEDKAREKIDSVLALPIKSLINWTNFIGGIEADEISYHTYHGTKGEEYENVAIILEHSFGRMNRDKFKNYFKLIKK